MTNTIIPVTTKLIYLGVELDNTKQHELITDHKFGFKVTVVFNENRLWPDKHEVFNNCHEVHFMYGANCGYDGDGPRVAFESNIHSTGGTRALNQIDSITIELATENAENW